MILHHTETQHQGQYVHRKFSGLVCSQLFGIVQGRILKNIIENVSLASNEVDVAPNLLYRGTRVLLGNLPRDSPLVLPPFLVSVKLLYNSTS